VYQNSDFTPVLSVSEWWLARTGCRERRSAYRRLTAAYAHPATQPPHPACP